MGATSVIEIPPFAEHKLCGLYQGGWALDPGWGNGSSAVLGLHQGPELHGRWVCSQAVAASCTPFPGVPGSAFRGACSTHSAFAWGQLGCPLLKLAPRIIRACLQIPSCLHKHGVLQEKSSVFAHPILCASNELWVFFQRIHGEGESILPDARPPCPGKGSRTSREAESWGTQSSSFSLGLLCWEGYVACLILRSAFGWAGTSFEEAAAAAWTWTGAPWQARLRHSQGSFTSPRRNGIMCPNERFASQQPGHLPGALRRAWKTAFLPKTPPTSQHTHLPALSLTNKTKMTTATQHMARVSSLKMLVMENYWVWVPLNVDDFTNTKLNRWNVGSGINPV